MKCSSCGAELAEGAKFCGECGAKVVTNKVSLTIDWNDCKISVNDMEAVLSKDGLDRLVQEVRHRVQKKATPGRVLIREDKGFKEKIENFISEYTGRVGDAGQANAIRAGAVALFDYSTTGSGRRGFVFTDRGVYNISNKTPMLEGGKCITGHIPWKVFFQFAERVEGNSYWKIRMSDITGSEDVDMKIKSQIKNKEHVEKLFYTSSATGLEPSFMAYELTRIKNAICGRDPTVLDPVSIYGVFRRLKSQLKTNRMYFDGDGAFEMKCDSFLQSAASILQNISVAKDGFTAMERTVRFKDDEPRTISIKRDDYLLLFDNTKARWFGDFDKRPCQFGGLITKKGILACNCYENRKGARSGFVTWESVSVVDPSENSCNMYGVKLFEKPAFRFYPQGLPVELHFDQVGMKRRYCRYYAEAVIHLWYLARGMKKPFDFGWYFEADEMGDAEDCDGMGDAENCD